MTPTAASFQVVPPLVRSIARAERCQSGERQRDNCWPAAGRQQRQAASSAERWPKRHRRFRRRNIVVPLSFLAIPFADYAAPCRKALGRVALHPIGELRRAHQAGLHRDVGEVRGRDGLFVASCRRRKTAEHGDDLDHERTPSLRSAFVLATTRASLYSLTEGAGPKTLSYIARACRIRRIRSRSAFGINRITSAQAS
jgi:hypothetical protein